MNGIHWAITKFFFLLLLGIHLTVMLIKNTPLPQIRSCIAQHGNSEGTLQVYHWCNMFDTEMRESQKLPRKPPASISNSLISQPLWSGIWATLSQYKHNSGAETPSGLWVTAALDATLNVVTWIISIHNKTSCWAAVIQSLFQSGSNWGFSGRFLLSATHQHTGVWFQAWLLSDLAWAKRGQMVACHW